MPGNPLDSENGQHLPSLSHLGIAILEHYASQVIGEKGVAVIKQPHQQKELRTSLEQALRQTEAGFLETCNSVDSDVCQIVLNPPGIDPAELLQIVGVFFENPADHALENALSVRLKSSGVPPEKIIQVVDSYLGALEVSFLPVSSKFRQMLGVSVQLESRNMDRQILDINQKILESLDNINAVLSRESIGLAAGHSGGKDSPQQSGSKPKFKLNKHDLVDTLLTMPSMQDNSLRNQVISNLPENIKTTIIRSQQPRADVDAIVSRCINFENGIENLAEAIRDWEAGTDAMSKIDEMLNKDY